MPANVNTSPEPTAIIPRSAPSGSQPIATDARSNRVAALAFLGPNLLAYALFTLIPGIACVVLGFYSWDLFNSPEWVGLDNYSKIFHDPQVGSALTHTGAYVVLGAIPTILLGFALAVLFNWSARTVPALRAVILLPLTVSAAVAGVLWSNLLSPQSGMVNQLIGLVGIDGPPWLGSTTWALPALTIVLIWLSLPLVFILYLAGLQRIPPEIYDAAELDGAGTWVRLWKITWPSVMSTTVLVVGLEFLQFLGAPFELSLIMTDGGPLNSTTSLSLYAYKVAFENSEVGYASVLCTFQLVVILGVIGLGLLATRRWRSR